jgi:hypothetical protein
MSATVPGREQLLGMSPGGPGEAPMPVGVRDDGGAAR